MELNPPKLEEKILKFWKENKIFEKSIEKRKKGKNFVFYDGPITVNALPGIHHVLARIFKDIIPRFKTMQGFRVERKNGWDTHGLPVELEVEKELGFKTKKDIEKYGIAKFNQACKKNVQKYILFFKDLTEKIGYWVDMENSYITYTPSYIETLWWIIKQIHKKGLLYKDYKVVPYCPRCGTSLSSHEVAQGYQRIKEPALYVKFKIKNSEPTKPYTLNPNTYLLVWTTTPWTLPGNVAIAVNPNFTYVKVKVGEEIFILVKEKVDVLGREYQILEEIKGKDLIGLRYQPLYPLDYQLPVTSYTVIPGDFVSLEEGTGLVHIAPAFGEEDMFAGKENNLPILLTVDEDGKYKSEVKNWAGMYVKEADPLIIEDLRKRNLLFKEEIYEHDYPFCWRCDSPLLYYAKESWFIKMQKVRDDLIKNNQKINWIPVHLKEGRFGEWLREVKDWALSRERYWGTPLPVWQCKKCGKLEIIGSREDLLSQKYSQNEYYLLRHGQSYWQTKYKKIILGWPEKYHCPLTKKGEREISKSTKKLRGKLDLIFTSHFLRTKQTAEIVKKETGAEIILDSRLRDIDHGILIGKKKDELYKLFPQMLERFVKKIPEGESWSDCKIRMLNFLKDIDKRYQGKKILIVSHGDPLWLLEGTVDGLLNEEMVRKNKKYRKIKTGKLKKIEAKFLPYDEEGNLNFHRPYIDEVKFLCQECDGLMERVPEVIDCWFDSGAMPFAQYHYPFENKKLIDKRKQFPADYISEAIDQTRGWFYTLLAISTLLEKGTPYKNVLSLGLVLDEKGEKMSKSKGNLVDPWEMIEKCGSDSLRWYFFTVNQAADNKPFSEREVTEVLRRFILTLWNSFLFFETYKENSKLQFKTKNLLDKWIISKLNELIQLITAYLDDYEITQAARAIEDFTIEDLSQWYIRRSRKRFQRPETEKELEEASAIFNYVLLILIKLTAPFIPFLSEEIYQKILNQKSKIKSIHLEDWPKVDKKLVNKELMEKMERVREIVTLALAERAIAGIKVRQPLPMLKIKNQKSKIKDDKELLELIKEEVNVKEIIFDSKIEKEVELEIKITPALKEEGIVREFIRQVQEMRKELGLKPKNQIFVQFCGSDGLSEILIKNKNFILKEVKAKDLEFVRQKEAKLDLEKETKIDGENLYLAIKKLK